MLISAILVFLTGCSTLKGVGTKISEGFANLSATECTQEMQEGCLSLRVLNLEFDAKNPLMKGLDQNQFPTEEERVRRAKTLPIDAYRAYLKGEVNAAPTRTYQFFMYNVDKTMSVKNMIVWQRNGTVITPGILTDITSSTPPRTLSVASQLGAPDKVFQVSAEAGAVSLQVPWSFFTKDSVIEVYSVRQTVYPGPQNGLWITSKYLNDTMRAGNWKLANIVFFHEKPKGTTAQTVAKPSEGNQKKAR